MRAMVFEKAFEPLKLKNLAIPTPEKGQVLIKVLACGLCRTDLHIFEGELKKPKFPLIMGHQIIGTIETEGGRFEKGSLVGVPWLGKSCGNCLYCQKQKENLCENPLFTGYTINGGFAEYAVAYEQFVFPLPQKSSAKELAPLLCAGMLGYRSLKMCDEAKNIGFYGFGAAAHLLIQVAIFQKKNIFAFTRKGDNKKQKIAKTMGAVWAGDSETLPPQLLDACILFAPVGDLVPQALRTTCKGGRVVCAEIHMSDIPSFPYEILWGERSIHSVANLTRQDGEEFLKLAVTIPIKTEITCYPLEKTNEALHDMKEGNISGTAVIIP